MVRVAIVPRALGPLPPRGCCRSSFAEAWESARADVVSAAEPVAAWKAFVGVAEQQLREVWCVDPAEVPRYAGRAWSGWRSS